MKKNRFRLILNCLILFSMIATSCSGVPNIPELISPTPTTEAEISPAHQQAYLVALIETEPPPNTVIGHRSPLTFYFNQAMNTVSVEAALSGLPEGTFTWNDEATLTFTPAQPYPPNTKLEIQIADSIQSASGFGISESIRLPFTVADHLRATNILPKENTTDVNVDAAIVASFNQPVVPLGADPAALMPAFTVQPPVEGRGEWVNTSTYIFYPQSAMLGGTEYTVSVNADLQTASGVGLDGSVVNAWKFVTARPRVVEVSPSPAEFLPPNPEIKLTFNQPMDRQSVQLNFLLSGTEGSVNGAYAWNEDNTELTFLPENELARGIGYTLNIGAGARSKSGITLGTDFGTLLRTYDNFSVTGTETYGSRIEFTFSAPLARGDYEDLVTITPALDDFYVDTYSFNESELYLDGNFISGTNYVIELSEAISDQWGQTLSEPFTFNFQTPPLPPRLNVLFGAGYNDLFVRPDEPVLFANAVNITQAEVTVAPITIQEFFSLQFSSDTQETFTPTDATSYSQTLDFLPNRSQVVTLNLTQDNNQLLPGLYFVRVSSPDVQEDGFIRNESLITSSHVNLTFKLGATEALVWAVDLPSQTPVANAPVTIYDRGGNTVASGITDSNGVWQGEIEEGALVAMLGAPGDAYFGLAFSTWSPGSIPWDFGYQQRVQGKHTEVYMYTDRPIYRPGQTVYYRGVVREAFNGRYELPVINSIPITLTDGSYTQIADINAQLSPFGTFNGQFELSQDAIPGRYTFTNSNLELYFSFQVAEYRKPEIDLNVDFSSDEILQGNPVQANVNARYFFDAPAGNATVDWSLYSSRYNFHLPGYQTGLLNYLSKSDFIGGYIDGDTGQTSPDGTLSIDLPAVPESESTQILTLEATVTDESGLPVSNRAKMIVHPADYYIGLKPDQWIGTADSPLGFEVYTVDWEQEPSGNKTL
ncbi:MAG: Ig-like domain-containing protein, partial [Anaerolineales bacterium]|nr:Ig-like domain-containing protein [Anaerolineales bacterium]